jgi:3-hydroxybutyryl-CoA dehydratase
MSDLAYEYIKVGDEASLARTITETHIVNFAGVTGDMNPIHVDAEYAAHSMFKERIAHGMLVAGLISAVLGTQLPGPNSIYLGQDLKFVAPVMIGDTIKVVVTVTGKLDEKRDHKAADDRVQPARRDGCRRQRGAEESRVLAWPPLSQ